MRFTAIYLLLLLYIIAALAWWEIALQRQNQEVYSEELVLLSSNVDSAAKPDLYLRAKADINEKLSKRTRQYAGEGLTFLVVIIIGAIVVYSSFRRRILLSRQQNNFMLSVTHELKSPIAAMKLNLQTLGKHRLDEAKQRLLVDRCVKESDRLNDLCNNMLLASQIEGRRYKPIHESFSLSEMAEDTVAEYDTRFPGRYHAQITPALNYAGDKVTLQMALSNLLENAAKYTPVAGKVYVKLTAQGGELLMSVADEGPGIPDTEKKKVFTKFYRIGNEESRKTKGTGLGLYLTQKIVAQHGGKITIGNNVPTGAVFQITLYS